MTKVQSAKGIQVPLNAGVNQEELMTSTELQRGKNSATHIEKGPAGTLTSMELFLIDTRVRLESGPSCNSFNFHKFFAKTVIDGHFGKAIFSSKVYIQKTSA